MPRAELPLIGPAYKNRELPLSAQVAKNLWPEINPEARNVVALHNAAGIRIFADLGGAYRGDHDFNNLGYWIMGQTLWSVDADGTSTSLGTIEGSSITVMADDGQQLIIVTGDKPYRYTAAGGVEEIIDPDLVKPTSVAYINQQFIFDQNDGIFGEFVTSSIEPGLSIDPLDFAIAESHPDDIIRVLAFRQLIYFYGSHSVEPWSNTGVGNPPWSRVDSGIQLYGLAGLHGVIATNKFMYFLDNRRIPRRSSGLDFVDIGNPALGVEFAKYSKIDDVIVFEFVQDNQQFVAFTFPAADRTWVFHEPSGSWFQLASGIDDSRHRASSMLNIYGLNYCADHSNGLIYEYSLDVYSDNGDPIIKQRDTAIIHGGLYGAPGKKIEYNMVEFIIVSGQTEVEGTGLGPQPITDVQGVCGGFGDLNQGELLGVGSIQQVHVTSNAVSEGTASENGVSFTDSKSVSFTVAFMREDTTGTPAHAIDLYDNVDAHSKFTVYMDASGFMVIEGRNEAGTVILDVEVTNNTASFADSELYFMTFIANLDDATKREVFISTSPNGRDGLDITDNTDYVTWTTYTDDFIAFADGGSSARTIYAFGQDRFGDAWGSGGGGFPSGIDGVCYLTFDDSCSLIGPSVWDQNGFIRDPQAWGGWYKTQPQVFFGPSFWKNSGKTAPAVYLDNDMEGSWDFTLGAYSTVDSDERSTKAIINLGVDGTTSATDDRETLPSAPGDDPQVEIVSPFWDNTGNWIDLSALTHASFISVFGTSLIGPDFNDVYGVDKAIPVNTSKPGIRLQIQDSIDATDASLFITDATGTVVDSMIYANVPNGDSVEVPTGADYFIVITSNTGSAKIKKWDTI